MSAELKFYSTNLLSEPVSFKDALLKGQAPDKGLYMPERIPLLKIDEIKAFSKQEYHEIAFAVAKKFLQNSMPDIDLYTIIKEAYNYPVPLEKIYERKYVMRLDQGPTASFKDFAARMMGRLMHYYLKKERKSMLILTATSGDTGSAIANAFYELDNIKVLVLYPQNEVTGRQRKQMTTLHNNIQIIALKGKFDDCQAMVKKAFADKDLIDLKLSSANSINIGRLLPQSMYYIYAYSRLAENIGDKIIFSVPSGNFGDLMGGLIAMKMGLPVKKFVVVTNENDEVPIYWTTGNYKTIVPSKNCISSAMNVGHPSNMARIVALYGGIMNEKGEISKEPDLELMRKEMFAVSVTDIETKATIKKAYEQYKLLLEPHGAVSWAGMIKNMQQNPEDGKAEQLCVCLETAHPAKFPEEINTILKINPELPDSMKGLEEKEEKFEIIENNYSIFKQFLQDNY